MTIRWYLLASAFWLAGCGGPSEPVPVAVGHCYRTLAEVDCYTTPEPNRQPLGLTVGPAAAIPGEAEASRDVQEGSDEPG